MSIIQLWNSTEWTLAIVQPSPPPKTAVYLPLHAPGTSEGTSPVVEIFEEGRATLCFMPAFQGAA